MCCLGVALWQTFHVKNSSTDPESVDNWHFASSPDVSWIVTTAVGLAIFLYGFIGFWLCDRKRKLWRITFHCNPLITNVLRYGVYSIAFYSNDSWLRRLYYNFPKRQSRYANCLVYVYCSRDPLVIFLLFVHWQVRMLQGIGLADQVMEIIEVRKAKTFYRDCHLKPPAKEQHSG